MNVKIQIRDTSNNIEGNLELQDSANFPLSLTIKSGDIAEISTRSGTFSTSFNIPATKENNKLLGSLYHSQIKNTKEYFVKKDALILVNDNVFQRGKLRIEQVNRNGAAVEYKAVFFGDNSEWIPLLKDVYLSDLSWDSTVTLNDIASNGITNSWSNTSANDEFIMTYENRGVNRIFTGRSDIRNITSSFETYDKNVNVEDFTPSLFIKQILKKGFSYAGYEFNSDFFNGDASALIHSHISENYRKNDTITNFVSVKKSGVSSFNVNAFIVNSYDTINDSGYNRLIQFNTVNSDVSSNYNTTSYYFEAPREGLYTFKLNGGCDFNTGGVDKSNFRVVFAAKRVAGTGDTELNFSNKRLLYRGYGEFETIDADFGQDDFTAEMKDTYLRENEKIYFYLGFEALNSDYSGSTIECQLFGSTTLEAIEQDNLVRSNTFNLKDVLDSKNHSILDLISDYTKLFNLYWRTDNKTKKVYCEPRNTFYKALNQAKNWTKKIDSSSYTLTPLASQFPRNLYFRYLQDSNDGYLAGRNEQTDINFGDYEHDLGSNFKDGIKKIETSVYSPTYFVNNDARGSASSYTHCSMLWSNFGSEAPEYKANFNPRILNLNTNGGTYVATSDSTDSFVFSFETIEAGNTVGYDSSAAIVGVFNEIKNKNQFNFDDTLTAKINLSFSTILSQKGLFAQYYNQTFELINEGFILRIKANLTATEISNFKLNDVIYFSAPYDIAGYWVLQEMSNIIPLQNNLIQLTLIQHKNFIGQDGSQEQINTIIEEANGYTNALSSDRTFLDTSTNSRGYF